MLKWLGQEVGISTLRFPEIRPENLGILDFGLDFGPAEHLRPEIQGHLGLDSGRPSRATHISHVCWYLNPDPELTAMYQASNINYWAESDGSIKHSWHVTGAQLTQMYQNLSIVLWISFSYVLLINIPEFVSMYQYCVSHSTPSFQNGARSH